MNKIQLTAVLILCCFGLGACVQKETSEVASKTEIAKCVPGEVTIEGYGGKGMRLANCFVEYPGEPTREDKSYYIVEDICGQFTGDFISQALGRKIIRIEKSKNEGVYGCSYYLDDRHYLMLILGHKSAEKQKAGHETMDRKVVTEKKIPINNYVVYQDDGFINSVYFILSNSKYLVIQRNLEMDNSEMLNFAARVGEAIKNYK